MCRHTHLVFAFVQLLSCQHLICYCIKVWITTSVKCQKNNEVNDVQSGVTLSPRAVESCPTPGDKRGCTSTSVSISGVTSHAFNGMSFNGVHVVQPSCPWPSSPTLSTHLAEHDISFNSAFLSHHLSKVS